MNRFYVNFKDTYFLCYFQFKIEDFFCEQTTTGYILNNQLVSLAKEVPKNTAKSTN
jgi:hypothetical protein